MIERVEGDMGIEDRLSIEEIRVYEGFNKSNGCVFCRLIEDFEGKILSNISQDLVMDLEFFPKFGTEYTFCDYHIGKFDIAKDKLGMAIMLKKLIDIQKQKIESKKVIKRKISLFNRKIEKEKCFVCEKIKLKAMKVDVEIAVKLWNENESFRNMYKQQKFFCYEHLELLMEIGKKELKNDRYSIFENETLEIQKRYYKELDKDMQWFINKFDYRYKDEPWYNSKDVMERAKEVLRRYD